MGPGGWRGAGAVFFCFRFVWGSGKEEREVSGEEDRRTEEGKQLSPRPREIFYLFAVDENRERGIPAASTELDRGSLERKRAQGSCEAAVIVHEVELGL